MPEDDWNVWAKYVLKEIERLAEVTDRIPLIEKDIAILQLKAGVWGALGGAIIMLGSVLFIFLSKK